jgi:hypothetical protein
MPPIILVQIILSVLPIIIRHQTGTHLRAFYKQKKAISLPPACPGPKPKSKNALNREKAVQGMTFNDQWRSLGQRRSLRISSILRRRRRDMLLVNRARTRTTRIMADM